MPQLFPVSLSFNNVNEHIMKSFLEPLLLSQTRINVVMNESTPWKDMIESYVGRKTVISNAPTIDCGRSSVQFTIYLFSPQPQHFCHNSFLKLPLNKSGSRFLQECKIVFPSQIVCAFMLQIPLSCFSAFGLLCIQVIASVCMFRTTGRPRINSQSTHVDFYSSCPYKSN